jgi:hypothetical protein
MRSERRDEPHLHIVAAQREAVAVPNRFSLLRLSLGARLLFVAAASVLLWGAVLWALR